MTVRLRIPELMKAAGIPTRYQLAQKLKGRVGLTTVYRLVDANGVVENVRADTLEALADLFGCDIGDLFEHKRRSK